MIKTDGKIYDVLGLEKSILSNDYVKRNLQIQCNLYQTINDSFLQNWNKIFHNLYGNTKDPEESKQS